MLIKNQRAVNNARQSRRYTTDPIFKSRQRVQDPVLQYMILLLAAASPLHATRIGEEQAKHRMLKPGDIAPTVRPWGSLAVVLDPSTGFATTTQSCASQQDMFAGTGLIALRSATTGRMMRMSAIQPGM